tara:strand:+ start:385 stop:1068 length:684 start_codon:yes stop_codon:yes gene_type:complete
MALILCVETSSKNCSVALSENGVVNFKKEQCEDNYCHGEQLHHLIEELIFDAKISLTQIDSFAFSAGPGSYTGLRIGASALKGLGIALNKEIILVSTLQAMCWGLVNLKNDYHIDGYNYFCSTLDSRQGEVYASIYDLTGREVIAPFACEVKKTLFSDILKTNKMCFFGPGLYKLQNTIHHQNASFLAGFYPSSIYLGFLAERCYNKKQFADIAYFEPMYLKDFISH